MLNQRKIDDAFVNQATNNMAYIYKDQAKQFIIAFLNKQISYRPFDAVRQTNGIIMSFIQLRGFIQIGKNYSHEMVIGVPRNFPQAPPIFLLSVNRALFGINREPQMLANKEISLQKDERGVQFIKFNFHFLSTSWKPMTSLVDVYNQLKSVINTPPLLVEINLARNNHPSKQIKQMGQLRNNNNCNKSNNINEKKPIFQSSASSLNPTMLTQMVDNKSIELSNSLSTLQQLEEQKDKLEYIKCRNSYLLTDHLKQLQTQLTAKSNQLLTHTEQVSKIKQNIQEKFICDDFLLITQKDQQKLQRMAERQALKQAQNKVKETLQTQLEKGNKYSDYKRIVRSLFTQMYQNQSKILQSAE